LDMCRVAEGTVDAYYEHGVKIWDVAAGIVIAREAGAQVRVPEVWEKNSARGTLVWAASAELAPAFERLLSSVGANGEID
ncbi:MAG: inositol monophosphatase family protein, partial [Corynebacterium casei]